MALGAAGTGRIKNGAVTGAKIKNNTVTGAKIKNYTIYKEDIHSGSINKYKLIRGAVNSVKILDGSILARDVADGAITSAKIANGQVTSAKIAANAVNSSKINNYSITKDDLHSNSVNSVKIVDGSITNADIANAAGIADSKISYSTKTKALSIIGVAFRSENSSDTFAADTAEGWLAATGAGDMYFYAPVHLPDDSIATLFRLNAYDNSAVEMQATLYRRSLDNSVTPMANIETAATSASWQNFDDNTINDPAIDNQNYQYFARVRLNGPEGTLLRLGAATVTYTVAAP